MPHHDKEENTTGNLTDMVAKESSDSNASTHPMHQVENNATSGGKATAEDHSANPGPVISQDIGEASSKEDNKKRAAELNK
ncbi:hypothetical protein E4T44_08526 [Aureobasidium sp. EXF-8845]|nr:hypothetical protein E4T44_08526 [Aureobasidium sp. EXF-8845]KAI4843744.1 hypothetical protein E4T45_08469 [Aureobasidium sp. EXF-8846]